MNRIKQTYLIAAPPAQVWRALTDARVIRKWSGARAIFPRKPGAPYSLWDGGITGEIVESVPDKKLTQTWKPDNWTRTDSRVTFTLTARAGGTRVDLVHTNVEEWDYEGTEAGWDLYYLGAIKRMLETPPAKKSVKKPRAKIAPHTKTGKKKKAAAVKR